MGGGGVRLAGTCRVDAVARQRGAGRAAVARNTIGVAEVLRLGSDGLFSAKKEHTGLIENFDRTSHYWSLLALHYQQQQQFPASAYEAYGSGVNVDFTMGTSSSYTGSGVKWPYKNKG